MTVVESPLFRQWNLLQEKVVPSLREAERRHGSSEVWALGSVANAVAVAVAYAAGEGDEGDERQRPGRPASAGPGSNKAARTTAASTKTNQSAGPADGGRPPAESGAGLWAYASDTGSGLTTVGFSLSDIRCVPTDSRRSSFQRSEGRWVPDAGIAERVLLSTPERPVDLLVMRGDQVSGALIDGDAASKLRPGGQVLFVDPPGHELRQLPDHGFERVGRGGQLWRKTCGRHPARSQTGVPADRTAADLSADVDHPCDTLAVHQHQAGLVSSHIRLAHSLAHRFSRHGESKDDLEQVALLALVKAARRFDPGREISFSTYATASILGEIKRHFRDRTWMLRVPRSLQELYLAVKEARETLTHDLGRSPTVTEIANHIGVSDEKVLEAMEAGDSYWPESLDVGVHEGESVREIPVSDPSFDQAVDRHELQELLPRLEHRERLILKRLYFDGWTQRQVADEIGVSQMQVSRLSVAIVQKLRNWAGVQAATGRR